MEPRSRTSLPSRGVSSRRAALAGAPFLALRASAAAAGVLLAACGSLGFEAGVDDREPFDPPPFYATWWDATRTCSGIDGAFGRITWFLASAITGDGLVARARWTPPHEIVIVRGYETDERTVRHEMLHDLLTGDRGHASPSWDGCDLRFE
ncbi:MAG: hypothetical protein RJQ04_01050 [Longimicrobiales bacterium]